MLDCGSDQSAPHLRGRDPEADRIAGGGSIAAAAGRPDAEPTGRHDACTQRPLLARRRSGDSSRAPRQSAPFACPIGCPLSSMPGALSPRSAAVALFWIVTTWPSGASAISFAAIIVILLSPRADQAYGAGIAFLLGILLNVVLTATIAFAVLPGSGAETFAAFSLVIGLCLVPIGAPGASASTLVGRDVHCDDDDLYAAARADESDGLRHRAVLQWHGCDRRRHRHRDAVVSIIAAIVAGVPRAPALGADLARSAPPRNGAHAS
jgi:hypothetical protein